MTLPTSDSRRLRDLLDSALRTDQDLNAFCLDFFPSIHQRFAVGMNRLDKINLLLQLVDATEIESRLEMPRTAAGAPTHSTGHFGTILAFLVFTAALSVCTFVAWGFVKMRHGVPTTTAPDLGFRVTAAHQKNLDAVNRDNQILRSPDAGIRNSLHLQGDHSINIAGSNSDNRIEDSPNAQIQSEVIVEAGGKR